MAIGLSPKKAKKKKTVAKAKAKKTAKKAGKARKAAAPKKAAKKTSTPTKKAGAAAKSNETLRQLGPDTAHKLALLIHDSARKMHNDLVAERRAAAERRREWIRLRHPFKGLVDGIPGHAAAK